jgi:NADH-quinone oxidoreductase subunit N
MTIAGNNLAYLMPEIIVVLTGALIIVIDLILPQGEEHDRRWLAYVGIAGLVLAAAAAVRLDSTLTAQHAQGARMFEGIIVLDPLGYYFKLLFIGIAIIVLLLTADSIQRFTKWPAEFYAFILWCTLGHMLLASAAELFTIFLALQLTSLPLIVLIGYAKHDQRSGEASLKYLLMVMVSTAVLLYGMTLIYGSLGTSTISEVGAKLASMPSVGPALALGLVLLVTGFAFKITAAPFHYWVPDVYEGAPTPVTAFLSVGSKFAGFALALRIIVTGLHIRLDFGLIFGLMAALSMTWGNLAAIRQTSIKRMLAYSGIAQAGYLLIGVAAMSREGIGGLLFYAAAYTFANLAAFGVIIVFSTTTGSDEISAYSGLSKRAPLLALALAVSLMSLGGLPLMAGFMAKFYVFLYAVRSGLAWLVAVGVLNSVVSLYYYLRVVGVMYVGEGDTSEIHVPLPAGLAMSFCSAGVLVLGLFPEPMLRAAQHAAAALFGG